MRAFRQVSATRAAATVSAIFVLAFAAFSLGVTSSYRFEALSAPIVRLDRAVTRATAPHAPPATAPGLNQFEITKSAPGLSGTILFAMRGSGDYNNRIVEIDRNGKLTWEYDVGRLNLSDVHKLSNGDVLFNVSTEPISGASPPTSQWTAKASSSRVLEVDRAGGIVRDVAAPVDHHAELLDNGNLLVVDSAYDMASEINSRGDIVWKWQASDHIRPYTSANFVGLSSPRAGAFSASHDNAYAQYREDFGTDWTHMNSAQRLPDGDTLLSLRNLDLVAEVNPAGDVVSTYGALMLKHQHCAWQLENGDFLISDNGNARIIEVDRATESIVWQYDQGLKFATQGCAYRLPNGDTLITDSQHLRVIEVTPAKDIVWELRVKTPGTVPLYRAWWSPN